LSDTMDVFRQAQAKAVVKQLLTSELAGFRIIACPYAPDSNAYAFLQIAQQKIALELRWEFLTLQNMCNGNMVEAVQAVEEAINDVCNGLFN
jgi:hypothetical protein